MLLIVLDIATAPCWGQPFNIQLEMGIEIRSTLNLFDLSDLSADWNVGLFEV